MAEEETTARDLEELIRSAQAQPGIVELMAAYGRSEELLRIYNTYLDALKPKSIIGASANSA